MAQYALVKCNINGKDVEKIVDVRASLTDMLRNDFRLTSVKKGCEVGECGACTALIDGEAINTCLYLAVWADGKHIITLEGLMNPDGTISDVQKAFMEETSIQCGFCILWKWPSARSLSLSNAVEVRSDGTVCSCQMQHQRQRRGKDRRRPRKPDGYAPQ